MKYVAEKASGGVMYLTKFHKDQFRRSELAGKETHTANEAIA
jgi:hypothetical protein